MTPEEADEAIKALQAQPLRICPICGHHQWVIVDLVELPIRPKVPGTVVLPAPAIPALLVACKTCHFLASFAAIPMGIGGYATRPKAEKEEP